MWVVRLIRAGILLFATLCLLIAGFATIQAAFEPDEFDPADVIVVLGADMDADGTLHPSTVLRVEKGVALFQNGTAPRMHFTGGRGRADGPAAGKMMARLAVELGVPEEVITHEDESLSTLQNALFSMPMLQDAKRIILVTEGFHLPRSWASFKWAAFNSGNSFDIALARSTAFRAKSPNLRYAPVSMVVREVLAWGFNTLRVVAWQGAGWAGVENTRRDGWLQ